MTQYNHKTHKTQMTQAEFDIFRDGFDKRDMLTTLMFRQLAIQKRRCYVDMLIASIPDPFPIKLDIRELPVLRMSRYMGKGKAMCSVEIEDSFDHVRGIPGAYLSNEDSRHIFVWFRYVGDNFPKKPTEYLSEIISETSRPLQNRSALYNEMRLKRFSKHAYKFTKSVHAMKLKPPLGVKVILVDRWREQILKHLKRFLYKVIEL